MQVKGVPEQRNTFDCGVHTCLMAEAVGDAIKQCDQGRQNMVVLSSSDGSAVDRGAVSRLKLLKAEHVVIYRVLMARTLLQEWENKGRAGDFVGRLGSEEARRILIDARWDVNLKEPICPDLTEEELRYRSSHQLPPTVQCMYVARVHVQAPSIVGMSSDAGASVCRHWFRTTLWTEIVPSVQKPAEALNAEYKSLFQMSLPSLRR